MLRLILLILTIGFTSTMMTNAQQTTPDQLGQQTAATLGQQLGLLIYENTMLRTQIQALTAENAKIKADLEAAKALSK